jgi:hypothetical protein
MSASDTFGAELAAWLHDEAEGPVPSSALEHALRATSARRPRPALVASVASHWIMAGAADPMREVVRKPLTPSRVLILALVALLAVALAGGAILVGGRAEQRAVPAIAPSAAPVIPPASPAPTPSAAQSASSTPRPGRDASGKWPGPVQTLPEMAVQAMELRPDSGRLVWNDGRDAPIEGLDITRVVTGPPQTGWSFAIAGHPPEAAELDAADTVLSYGLVFETTGDGRADYVLGINSDAPVVGDYRVWITDLATGETQEQVGPPYGRPIEFSHPSETSNSRVMSFWFINGNVPFGSKVRSFYAWSALTRAGETVAWDYAPDAAWLSVPV